MSGHSALMLVSANADSSLRREVAEGVRPRPEYLLLEADHGVELLDWSKVPGIGRKRSRWRSAVHAAAALRLLDRHPVVFSDGEHVGIPLAIAVRTLGIRTPHLVIGHHLTTRSKARFIGGLGAHQGMSRIIVHSRRQAEIAQDALGVPAAKLVYEPYCADTVFWRPAHDVDEEALVVSAGREHRDYETLASACEGIDAKVFVAAGSVHSPGANSREPSRWPSHLARGFADYRALRQLYARAGVVVVPLTQTDFQAGVTTILEAMAMGKAVVATETIGSSNVLIDGVNGIAVRPGDPIELRHAINRLLGSPAERRRLGSTARDMVTAKYDVAGYAQRLAGHITDLASRRVTVAA